MRTIGVLNQTEKFGTAEKGCSETVQTVKAQDDRNLCKFLNGVQVQILRRGYCGGYGIYRFDVPFE